jgi:hypothetical protein
VSLFSIIEARTLERFALQWNYQCTRTRGHEHAGFLHELLRAAGQAGTATAINVLNLRVEVASQD